MPNSGDPANGMVLVRDGNYPPSFVLNTGEMLQPRFGLAWDVFGNGKTAIRTGFAKFNQTPSVRTPIARRAHLVQPDLLLRESGHLPDRRRRAGPGQRQLSATGHQADQHLQHYVRDPAEHRIRHGVGRKVRFRSRPEFGEDSQHQPLPYGARFLPQNIDPTTGSALIDNFLRPYGDYGSITYRENSGSSNYHALQTTINRRFTGGLQFGAAYTYSKTMDYGTSFPMYQDYRKWNYGMADFDQTHILT